ncbi:uncharacterized protein zgc:175136 [Danio aesculapii]|uniref:uncharacterized protein zgc:175136 n=1 Tax=Danio aesculapii TaxID=1142201 RepID=UPI0024C031F7|nr:uncharacterized protein zgc:175136 [Danio aesculapii]
MGPRYGSIFLFALFPAIVTCWGNYEGSMPDGDVQRFLTPTLPVMGSEVKQKAVWKDLSYGSVRQPHYRGTHENYDAKERLFVGSNAKSNTEDCQGPAKNGHQENINFNLNSLSKYGVSSCGQSSTQYESRTGTNALKNVQAGSRLASTLSQSGPTLRKTLKVPELSSLKLSRGESSYEAGQGINNVQIASNSFGPLLKGSPVHSNMNPGKHTQGGPSVVSSGPVFVVQGKGSALGQNGFLDSVKPPVHRHFTPYKGSQSWKKTFQYSKSGTQHNLNTELRKPSKSDCKDNAAKSIASSGEVFQETQESTKRNPILPHHDATYPKFQQVHNTRGQSNQMFKPMYPSQNGAQQNVGRKSTFASSGGILVQQAPTDALSGKESNNRNVYPSFSEREVTFASGQTSHQYQPFKVTQNSKNAQPATNSYTSSSQTGYQTFSSLKGTSYKPSSGSSMFSTSVLSATNPNFAGPNEINTVHVRPNKPFASSFGQVQSQRPSGDRGAFQSFLPSSYLGLRPSEEVQTSVSSAPFHGSKRVQNQLVETQENTDDTRCITTIPSEFGQGAIQRLSPKHSSKYRRVKQNGQERLDFVAPKCYATQNNHAGLGQKGSVNFQEVNQSV